MLTRLQVVLSPGEVLYLPPFWFHRVIAEDISISVNTFYDSEEVIYFYDKIMLAPFPFPEDMLDKAKRNELVLALKYFIQNLVDLLKGKDASKEIIRKLVEQRYLPIFGPFEGESPFQCDGILDSSLIDQIKKGAPSFVEMFTQLKQFSGDEAIQITMLNQFIEIITENFLSVKHVNYFLQKCFT